VKTIRDSTRRKLKSPIAWLSENFLSKNDNIRILFVDFRKAFIDHNVLFYKFLSSGVPEHIIAWSLDFLNDHKPFVKIGDSVSATTTVADGTPQGTVSGLNDFKVIINDLTFNTTYTKHVNDTTVLFVSRDVHDCILWSSADFLVEWWRIHILVVSLCAVVTVVDRVRCIFITFYDSCYEESQLQFCLSTNIVSSIFFWYSFLDALDWLCVWKLDKIGMHVGSEKQQKIIEFAKVSGSGLFGRKLCTLFRSTFFCCDHCQDVLLVARQILIKYSLLL